MANVPVPQYITGREIRRRADRLNAPYGTVAFFAGINASVFSLVLSGKKALSWEAQSKVSEVLAFLEELAKRTTLPVDFSNIGALSGEFVEYEKMQLSSEVAQTNSEINQEIETK